MSADDLEKFEAEMELGLYKEYRDVFGMFRYVVETDKRFYLANEVDVHPHADGPDTYFEVSLNDAWVWDMYRTARFVGSVRILTFSDVNIEELKRSDIPDSPEGLTGD
ncbi:MAG TPA: DUF2469 domain-containing protein [Actinomycetota bacterium]